MELSTCRPGGMGLSPIPYTAIVQYADEEAILDRFRFRTLIRRMDQAVMSRYQQQAEEARSVPPKPPPKRRSR